MAKILEELLKATKSVAKKKAEADQAFLTRVVEATSKLTDEAFNKLTAPAQTWFNAAAEAINKGTAVTLPDADGAAPAAPAAASTPKIAPKGGKGATPAAPAAATAAPAAAPAKAAKEPKAPAPAKVLSKKYPGIEEFTKQRPDSVGFSMRIQVVQKPDITFEAAAKKAGITEPVVGSHAWNEWNYTRSVMEVVKYVESTRASATA